MGKVNIAKIFGSDVKDIMRLLNSSGKDCYIVGGAVRDLLLQHKELSDIDLTTPLRVEQLKQILTKNQEKFHFQLKLKRLKKKKRLWLSMDPRIVVLV